jgi:hypothetical protein
MRPAACPHRPGLCKNTATIFLQQGLKLFDEMKFTGLHSVLCSAFLLLGWIAAAAQEKTKAEARIDRDSIFIGQQITLSLQADIPETDAIRFFSVDSIEHFEFIQKGEIDTANTSGGTRLSQQFIITSFDSGRFVIPAFVLDETAGIKTDSFVVDVSFSPFDPQQEYHKVKDIIEVEPVKEKDNHRLFIAGAGLLLLLLLLYLLLRKKKPTAPAVIAINPYEKAMNGLKDIETAELNPKEYYSRLTDIFREYLQESQGIHSLQKTTDDLVMQIRLLKLDKELFNSLSQSLRLCDFVKFAKYIPGKEDDRLVFEAIKNSISFLETDKTKEKKL